MIDPQNQQELALPSVDHLLASAIRYLLEGAEKDAADLLVQCNLAIDGNWEKLTECYEPTGQWQVDITLRAPRRLYEWFCLAAEADPFAGVSTEEEGHELSYGLGLVSAIRHAIRAIMPSQVTRTKVNCRADIVTVDEGWRQEAALALDRSDIHNQAFEAERVVLWMNLRFRSQAEARIAQALDDEKAIFFPNCKARLGISKRENREPDFLIGKDGKWGILEVDGGPFHPPSRTVDDHERDRLFKAHGIKLVEHFDAAECFENARQVVKKFLFLLTQS